MKVSHLAISHPSCLGRPRTCSPSELSFRYSCRVRTCIYYLRRQLGCSARRILRPTCSPVRTLLAMTRFEERAEHRLGIHTEGDLLILNWPVHKECLFFSSLLVEQLRLCAVGESLLFGELQTWIRNGRIISLSYDDPPTPPIPTDLLLVLSGRF